MRVSPRTFFPVWALVATVFTGAASAQSRTTSALRGTVSDKGGAPISDVVLEVRHQATGVTRTALTNAEGVFLVFLLPPGGPYNIRATRLGYADTEETGVYLAVGAIGTVEMVMPEQALPVEGVTVTVDRAETFEVSRIGSVTRLDERTLESMPVLSRRITDLAVLSPLVTRTSDGGLSVLGQNDRYNAILVDGVSAKDVFGLTAAGTPGAQAGAKVIPMDAIQQFEVLLAPFDVRLSSFVGGVMNAVTRSGTNDWRVRAVAVGRHEAFTGDLYLPTGSVEASGVDRSIFALSVGGPIVRDRAHFFVATELEKRNRPPAGYNLFRDPAILARISEESMGDFQERFESSFGLETGMAGPYTLGQSLANVFARVDWTLGERHRLTARHVYASAENDESPNRSTFEPYGLSSNAVIRDSNRHAANIQLFTDFGRRGGNELSLEVERSHDATLPAVEWPQVEIDLISPSIEYQGESAGYRREARVGAQFYAQDNDLRQTTVRATNATTLVAGHRTLTFGMTAAYYEMDHRYLPGSRGSWYFADPQGLEVNAPQRFQQTVLAEGEPDAVNISVFELGGFFQNETRLADQLTLRAGIRVDVPLTLDRPEENPEIKELFGLSTANVPSGTPLLSPRIGVNWQASGSRRTQLRIGAGVFTGQIPFVWLSNAFHHNGLRQVTRVCEGRWTDEPKTGNTAPPFDPSEPYPTCMVGPPIEWRDIVAFDEDFKYPQNYRLTIGLDRELTDDLEGSVGFMFNHAVNQIAVEHENLGQPTEQIDSLFGYGGYLRYYYGNLGRRGYVPVRKHRGYEQVMLVTNEGRDWAFSLSGELRGRLGEDGGLRLGYSFARAFDHQSLTHLDMVSNFGANPISADPNRPPLTPSNFDRPHRLVATVFGSPIPGLSDTRVSLLYTGQSGLPFSYVYRGDLNGDGFPGLGSAFDWNNDLMYVPAAAQAVSSTFATYLVLKRALEMDPCLKSQPPGEIMQRNHCRAPFQHRLDLRLSQTARIGGAEIRLEADVVNFLNLLNSGWGRIQTIAPTVSMLEPFRVNFDGELMSRWSGGVLPTRDEEGRVVPSLPWTVATPESQWQAQLGVHVTFGRRPRQ